MPGVDSNMATENYSRLTASGFIELLKDTGQSYGEDKVARLAAALAYYTIFSLSPLLVIALSIATLFYGEQAARGEIASQIQNTVGPNAAGAIQEILQNAHAAGSGGSIVATVVSLGIALWGASNLFGALQDAMNTVWGVAPKPDAGVMEMVRDRLLSFSMVLGIGFLLLVSLVATTVLNTVTDAVRDATGAPSVLFQLLNFAVFWALTSWVFGLMFKLLPDAEIEWRDVIVGAVFTGLLFSVARLLLSLYLSQSAPGSAFGSAGTLVALLLWINYSATIFLIGAEFTKAHANRFGSHIVPDEHAMAITEEARAREGLAPRPSVPGAKPGPGERNERPGAEKRPVVTTMSAAQVAQLQAQVQKARAQEAQFSLAVIVGGVLASLWFLRKRD